MVAKKATISRTPADIAEALQDAERDLELPPDSKQQDIQIRPALIVTRPELFQPRGFSTRSALDIQHVTKLIKRIATKGELEPPLVVKLGKEWVCVDGHHRIAAYVKHHGRDWQGKIRCQWFAGSIREAVDESVKRNDVVKLEMRRGDKYEAAWQRVVLDWGSKREIKEVTGVSDRLVGNMRAVVAAYKASDVMGRTLRSKLSSLRNVTWSEARNAYLNLSPAEWNNREAAGKLARVIKKRLHGKLSENKMVTALALAIYDPDLPGPLAAALREVQAEMENEDEGDVGETRPEQFRHEVTSDLLDDLGRLRARNDKATAEIATTTATIAVIEEELRGRGWSGTAAGETASDATWRHWIEEDAKAPIGGQPAGE
jgi:ParB/Sulfiredoxin domain